MMAEGNYYLMRREEFAAKFPDVPANDVGISNITVLGIEAVGTYVDAERDDWRETKYDLAEWLTTKQSLLERVREYGVDGELVQSKSAYFPERIWRESELLAEIADIEANPELAHSQRCSEAHDWFMKNAEKLYCWT